MKKVAMLLFLASCAVLMAGCPPPVETELEGIWTIPEQDGSAVIHLDTIEITVPIVQQLKMQDKVSEIQAQVTIKGEFSLDTDATPKLMTIKISDYSLDIDTTGMTFEELVAVAAVQAGIRTSKIVLALVRRIPITISYSLSGDDLTLEGLGLPFIPVGNFPETITLHRTGAP
jgi:hypothetical protein